MSNKIGGGARGVVKKQACTLCDEQGGGAWVTRKNLSEVKAREARMKGRSGVYIKRSQVIWKLI